MEWLLILPIVLISYVGIQVAIDRTINTKILEENYRILVEISYSLKEQNKSL